MLQIKNLTKVYKSNKGSEIVALDNISVDFGDNGLLFLSGKSGCGKSTLLNLLGGIDTATSGEIVVNGRSFNTFSDSDYDSYRNTCVGFVFQEYNLIDNYSVGENISIALELQGKKADKSAIEAVLRQVELADDTGETLIDRRINELSGGQKQRVAIARALIKNPRVILADEPTGALDSETGSQLYELLKNLSKSKLIIVVSHDSESAKEFGDRIIELKDGRLVSDTGAKTIDSDDTMFLPIKSRLPASRSFKMGASALKHKKFRLVLSIILSFVSFSVFGFSFTAIRANTFIANIKTMYENNMRMAIIVGDSIYDPNGLYESHQNELKEKQVEEIIKYNASGVFRLADSNKLTHHLTTRGDAFPFLMYYGLDSGMLDAISRMDLYVEIGLNPHPLVEIDPQTGAEDANLRPDQRFVNKSLCRLPANFDEIAITDIRADMFMRFGHRANDGTISEINTPDDLIGKTLGSLTICGVYSTEIDINYLKEINKPDKISDYHNKAFLSSCLTSILTYNYVKAGYADDEYENYPQNGSGRINDMLMLKLSGNLQKDRALFKAIDYRTKTHKISAALCTPYSIFVFDATFFEDFVLVPAIIAALVFMVFSTILTMNFLLVSMDYKRKELGILRALGARSKDIISICLIESLLIAGINFILSLIAVVLISGVLNKLFFITLFIVGPVEIAALFLLVFAVSSIATILPARRLARKKPVDVINEK